MANKKKEYYNSGYDSCAAFAMACSFSIGIFAAGSENKADIVLHLRIKCLADRHQIDQQIHREYN